MMHRSCALLLVTMGNQWWCRRRVSEKSSPHAVWLRPTRVPLLSLSHHRHLYIYEHVIRHFHIILLLTSVPPSPHSSLITSIARSRHPLLTAVVVLSQGAISPRGYRVEDCRGPSHTSNSSMVKVPIYSRRRLPEQTIDTGRTGQVHAGSMMGRPSLASAGWGV